jgi:NDP-sugar pyrophosphorylase family protein
MAVREYEHQVPFGVVNQQNGEITSIVEKPSQRYYVNAGMYILSPDVLKFIPDNKFFDMPILFEKLIKSFKKPISFPIHEYWLDIGHINQLEQARAEYFNIFEE